MTFLRPPKIQVGQTDPLFTVVFLKLEKKESFIEKCDIKWQRPCHRIHVFAV